MEKFIYSQELKERQYKILIKLNQLGVNGFISDLASGFDYRPFLKEITDILRKVYKTKLLGYSVKSIWFTDGENHWSDDKINVSYLSITALNRNYDKIELSSINFNEDKTIMLDGKTLGVILDKCEELVTAIEKEIDDNKKLPEISTMMETLLKYADNVINHEYYNVSLEKGNFNYEKKAEKPYTSIVVRHDNGSYIGAITFGRDNLGGYTVTSHIPLCGACTRYVSIETMETAIRDIIIFMTK